MSLILHRIIEKPLISNRIVSSFLQVFRWKKRSQTHPTKTTLYRKPRWLPIAKSKLFKIPQHPYVSPEENDLVLALLEEYRRYMTSLGKLFKEEVDKRSDNSAIAMELTRIEEEQHKVLMEENRQENERIKLIREEIREKEFQEKAFKLLEQYEEEKKIQFIKKTEIENIVRKEKEQSKRYITHENLENSIEEAIDKPINKNFCIDTKGNVLWEAIPPKEYEDYVYGCLRVQKSLPES